MRKTFANTIRPDVRFTRSRKGVTVTHTDRFGKLEYRSHRANAHQAELLNSKIPACVINPPFHP